MGKYDETIIARLRKIQKQEHAKMIREIGSKVVKLGRPEFIPSIKTNLATWETTTQERLAKEKARKEIEEMYEAQRQHREDVKKVNEGRFNSIRFK